MTIKADDTRAVIETTSGLAYASQGDLIRLEIAPTPQTQEFTVYSANKFGKIELISQLNPNSIASYTFNRSDVIPSPNTLREEDRPYINLFQTSTKVHRSTDRISSNFQQRRRFLENES